jgi:cytochrome b6-f complex iron-sulfur subunit
MGQSAQMLNPTAQVTRRQFLAIGWTVAGLVAAGEAGAAMLAFMYPRLEAGAFGGKLTIGSVADIIKALPDPNAVPNETYKQTGRFFLTRTDDGLLALYRKCVHLGCVVPWNSAEDIFHCVCHGSKYNRKGEVLAGPAPRPLDYFAITQKDDTLVVDTSNPLKRSTYEPSQVFPLST